MKLLFLVESIQLAEGGPPQIFANLINSLVRDFGDEISIVCRKPVTAEVELDQRVKRSYLADQTRNPISWWRASRQLRGLIKANDATFVGGVWGPYDGLALRFANVERKRIFIVAFGMLQPYILARNAWKKWLAWNAYVKANLLRAEKVIVNSALEGDQVAACGVPTGRIATVPIGLDLSTIPIVSRASARQVWGVDESKRVLLYLGRIHPKKGLDLLIPAFTKLLREDPDWRLVVAGAFDTEDFRVRIETLVENLALGDVVRFVGPVQGDAKWQLFRAADLFVLPSHSEGFSMAVLESMAAECPAVVTRGCNFPAIESDAGGFLADASVESLSVVFSRVQREFRSLQMRGSVARSFVQRHYGIRSAAECHRKLVENCTH